MAREAEVGPAPAPPLSPDFVWMAVLGVVALAAMLYMHGSSPSVWVDTLVDNDLVHRCLRTGRCTTVGVGSTVGLFHTVGYLDWRAFLDWVGFDQNHTHLTMLTMTSAGTVITALVARRLGGLPAGALAAVLYFASLIANRQGAPMQTDVVSDVAPMPFLGCVFLLAAGAAHLRPSYVATVAMALSAVITANCYATGFLCAVSMMWVVALLPANRGRHAALAAIVFLGVALVMAPGTFAVDIAVLTSERQLGSGQVGARRLSSVPIVAYASVAVLGWLVAAVADPPTRRRLDVPFATMFPLYILFVLGAGLGVLEPQDKYFSHVVGGSSVLLALSITALGRKLLSTFEHSVPPGAAAAAAVASPYGAVLAVGYLAWLNPHDDRPFDYRDLTAVVQVLVRDHGWHWTTAVRNLHTADDMVRQSTLRWATGWPEVAGNFAASPGEPGAAQLQSAYLTKVEIRQLPPILPEGLDVLTTRGDVATVLAVSCSWIDWRAFTVCEAEPDGSAEVCTDTGFGTTYDPQLEFGLPGMPVSDARKDRPVRRMRLRFPLHARPDCPAMAIDLSAFRDSCPGRIASIDGGSHGVAASQKSALLTRDPASGAAPRELVLEWMLGGPDCYVQYRGYPPAFLEGNPEMVDDFGRMILRVVQGSGQERR